MTNPDPTQFKDVLEACKQLVDVDRVELTTDVEGPFVLSVPAARNLVSVKKLLAEYLPRPERRQGLTTLSSVDSFIEIVERFKNPDSVIFADYDSKSARLLAVFDYHQIGGVLGGTRVPLAGEVGPELTAAALAKVGTGEAGAAVVWPVQIEEDVSARFGEHRALYEFPISEEWQRWKASNEKRFTQDEFAQFIEDNLLSVADPDKVKGRAINIAETLGIEYCNSARLLRLSRGLAINANVAYTNIHNLQTGESKISYEEIHTGEGGATLDIPGGFLLNLPVFVDSTPFQIVARLRYQKQGKQVLWYYSIYRMDQVFELAIKDEAQRVKQSTGLPVLLGKPGGKKSTDE